MARTVRSRMRRSALIALAAAVGATTLLGGVGPAGAAKEKVDRDAVLKAGLSIEDNGGVFFDPCSPRAAANPSARMWLDLIYGTMIEQTPDGKGKPGLATDWSTPDASTVEVTLRDGVTFADGQPFTADAVVKAWSCLLTGQRPNRGTDIEAMKSVEKVDDTTVRVRLSTPSAANWVNDTLKNSTFLGVPSPAVAPGTGDTTPVGAGPYRLKSYTTGKITLDRNPEYHDPKAQKLAGYEIVNVAVGPPSVSALQAGSVDLIWSFPPDSVATLENTPGITVYSAPSARQFQIGICPTQGVFANKTARQALQWAIDRKAIDEGALDGTGAPNQTLLTPASPYFDKALAKTYRYDPKKARALLKEAGVAEGTEVTLMVPAQPPYSAIGELVQSQLEAVGLKPVINLTSSYAADAARLKPDLATASMDPSLYALVFERESPLNPCGWSDPAVVAALNAVRDASKSPAELQEAWDEFQTIALDESVNIITNLQGLLVAFKDDVRGMKIVNAPYGPQLDTVYVVK